MSDEVFPKSSHENNITNLPSNNTVMAESNHGGGAVTGNVGKSSEQATDEMHPNEQRFLPEKSTPTSTSTIENLPPELRLQLLLSIPSISSLRSLVRASPVMHAQYLDSRDTILRNCLALQFDGYLLDTLANLAARVRVLGRDRTDERITKYLKGYQAGLSGEEEADITLPRDGEIRWMARYHLCVAQPLARLYSHWALENLRATAASGVEKRETTSPATQSDDSVKLSRSEEIRIFRAVYRYDIFYRLFGQNKGRRIGAFRHHIINEIFFGLFEPWEAEAIGCLDLFIRHKYDEMFDKVKEDLHPDNPKYNVSTSFRDEAHDLIALYNDYMDGTISRGLEVFMRMMTIEDHDKLLAKMDWCLTHDINLDYSLRRSISAVAQDDRRTLTDNAHNAKDNAELQPMEFLGDNHVDGPPFAWVLLWNGKYSNAIGEYVPKLLKQLGCVFWDKKRIVNMEAEALIAKQWESHPGLVEEIYYDRGWAPAERLPQESATNALGGADDE